MAAQLLAFGAGALLVVVGLLVWAAGVSRARGWLAGALLALWGGATIATGLVDASGAEVASAAAHLGIWYSLPVPLLMVALVAAVAGVPPTRAQRIVLAVAAAATLLGVVAFALRPQLFLAGVVENVDGQWRAASGPWLYGFAGLAAVAEAYAIHRAAMHLREGGLPPATRLHLAALAFALMLPLVHNGAFFLSFSALGSALPVLSLVNLRAGLTVLAPLAVLPALRAVARELRAGPLLLALVGGIGLVGLFDGVVGALRLQLVSFGGYATSFVLVRLAFAVTLAYATARFGLADVGAARRPRALALVRAGILVASAIVAFTLAALVVGGSTIGIVAAAVAALVVPAALVPISARMAKALLLPPDDPRAVAERARRYAAALAASQGAGAEGVRYLASLREDLGISEREHALLAQGIASREVERYRSVQKLGRGATAQVELAVDEVAGRRVVVKRFTGLRDPAAALREARSLAAVKHPRVVGFLEVDRRGEDVHLVLAYAEGGSVRELLDREGPLPPERALALARDLLEGLDALHAAGIVHGDVKPENLLLDAAGRGMLGDFGSARFVAPDVVDATLTGAAAEGSLSTASPEALRGAPPAPARDVYAAGALLYRLLTGEHYVRLADATVFEARERILLDAPRLPHPRVPATLEPVIRKALAKSPDARFSSAGAMRDALD